MTRAPVTVRTLLPMACDGAGPAATCMNLLPGMMDAGVRCSVHVNRNRVAIPRVPHRSALPGPAAWLPYRRVAPLATRVSRWSYLRSLRDGDVAYLWPSVRAEVHRTVHRRGNPIVLEGINTRLASAQRILDEAYRKIGLTPQHGITNERVEEEEEILSLATALFAPNVCVERALADTHLASGGLIPTSYGASLTLHRPGPPRRRSRCRVSFVGTACVRKGIHLLLEAWERAAPNADLYIAGRVEPAIEHHCARQLAREDVLVAGFVKDVRAVYRESDVFVMPSLEEGGPQVTYEAAAYGIPIIASPMGASRMGETGDCVLAVDPEDTDAMAAALTRLVDSPDERAALGARAQEAVRAYDWPLVGQDRGRQLLERFGAAPTRP